MTIHRGAQLYEKLNNKYFTRRGSLLEKEIKVCLAIVAFDGQSVREKVERLRWSEI